MQSRRRRILALAAGLLFAFALVSGALIYWRVRRVVRQASGQAEDAGKAAVSLIKLQADTSAFEPVRPGGGFRSAAAFNGDLWACSSSALFRYRNGQLRQSWFVGRDLPAAPLRLLAVRQGISRPELWIGTEGAGIVRYDGAGFEQLQPASAALRQVTALLPLHNGSVLVGTAEAGVYVSDGRSLRLLHPLFAKAQVTALAGDEDAFWIGTRHGAWLWQGGQATPVNASLPDADVLSLCARGDRAWVGTALGVSEFSNGRLTRQLAEGIFAQALAERDGTLWIGTVDQGTPHLALASRVPHALAGAETPPDDRPSAVAFSEADERLLAIDGNSIRALPGGPALATAGSGFLAEAHVTALQADMRGQLWVGTFDRGLDILDLVHGNRNRHLEDDVLFCINRIKENAERGITAVATANGLALFNASGERRQVLDREHGLIASHVTDVLFRKPLHEGGANDALMVATPAGLTLFEGSDAGSLSGFQGLVNNHVYTLAEVNDAVFAGTLGGVSVIRGGRIEGSYNTANSELKQNWITASASLDGRLYLGTYGSGVVQMQADGATAAFPAFAHRRIEINANALLATSRALYAGTSDHGLAILRRGDARWQFVTAGLPSPDVTALAERGGTLYVGTVNGLVRVEETVLLP